MDKINILWTTDNKDTVFNMLSKYALNSIRLGWWKNVNIILWGASVKLTGNDSQVQTEVLEMLQNGISVEACKECCDSYNIADTLLKLGVNVRYMGQPLTEYIKAGEKVITL